MKAKKPRYRWQQERKLLKELLGIVLTRHPDIQNKKPQFVDFVLKIQTSSPTGTFALIKRSFKFT